MAFIKSRKPLWIQTVMEIHREIWNNDISDRSCLWVYLIVISAEFTEHHGCSKWNWLQVHKSQNLYKEVFHRTWYMVRQHMEEVRSSSGSICRVRLSAVPVGRKTSPNKGIHPAYQGYSSETPSQKIFFHYKTLLTIYHVSLIIP